MTAMSTERISDIVSRDLNTKIVENITGNPNQYIFAGNLISSSPRRNGRLYTAETYIERETKIIEKKLHIWSGDTISLWVTFKDFILNFTRIVHDH